MSEWQLCVLPKKPRPHLMEPIKSTNSFRNKPDGGLWTSTWANSTSDWVEWAKGDGYPLKGHWWLLQVQPTAKLFTIDTLEDLISLTNQYGVWPESWVSIRGRINSGLHDKVWRDIMGTDNRVLDFEAILAAGYDGIHLTHEGQWRTRLTFPGLYGWDCESTIWFRWCFDEVKQVRKKL